MATITSATYLDDGTARTAGETFTLNGGILTIRTDTRVHVGAPASNTGSLGAISNPTNYSAGVLLDGRDVREVWFNSGTGNVPAIGSSITQGAVSGYLLGVWANLNSLPTAVGTAMPTDGFIKFREVTGGSFAAGALTNIGATATGADTTSWIEVVQRNSVANTIPRTGFFQSRGAWYYLNGVTTSGSANQTVQIPSMGGSNTHVPAIWIETGVGTNTYECYPSVSSTYFTAVNLATDVRCKVVRTIGSGQVVIGHTGSGNAGFVPVSGCKIRIPNVLGRQSTSGSDASNDVPNATIANRPDWGTANGGNIDLEYFMADWHFSYATPNEIKLKYGATFDQLLFTSPAVAMAVEDFHVGVYAALNIAVLSITNSPYGGTYTNCKFFRGNSAANGHVANLQTCMNYTFTNCHFGLIEYARPTSGRSMLLTTCSDISLNDIYQYNAQALATSCSDISIKGIDHNDRMYGNTNATTGLSVFTANTNSNNILVDGVTFGMKGVASGYHNPYASIFDINTASNVTFRNAGTQASPLLCENSTNAAGYILNIAGGNENIRAQRCYLNITRTDIYSSGNANATRGLTIESLHGTVGAVSSRSMDSFLKGVRATSVATGVLSAVYGSFCYDMFTADTTGVIWFHFNEPTDTNDNYVTLTLTGTIGGFNSNSQVLLPNVGDSLVVEMPYFAIGHTAFSSTDPTVTTTAGAGTYQYDYDIDTGSGFSGSWATLSGANLAAETISASQGVKLKVKVTTLLANTAAISVITIPTVSTLSAQTNNLYILDNAEIEITNLRAGSRVQIYDVTNSVERYNQVVAGTSLTYSAPYASDYTARVRVMYATTTTADEFIEFSATVTVNGLFRSVIPEVDPIYVSNAVNGFAVTGIEIDDTNLLIKGEDGSYAWAQIYAYETAWLFSEAGIRDEGRFITAIDSINYVLENFKIKNISSPSLPLIITGGWGRDSVTGLSATLIDTTGGTIFSNPDLVIAIEGGSGLTPAEQAQLSNIEDISEKVDGLIENSSGNRFTAKALEQAPDTPGISASAVWSETLVANNSSGTFGYFVQKLLSVAKFLGLK